MFTPNREQFMKKARPGAIVPVYAEVLADTETPVSAFKKTREGRYAYLLESVESGVNIGRYSIIGFTPKVIFRATGHEIELVTDGHLEKFEKTDPLKFLEEILGRYTPDKPEGLDLPFWGGAVGYIGYDYIRFFERIPHGQKPSLAVPDLFFVVMKNILVFDQLRHKIFVIHNAFIGDEPEAAYQEALDSIDRILVRFGSEAPVHKAFFISTEADNAVHPEFEKSAFLKAVETIKEHIKAGDIFQAVLSQRFRTRLNVDPFNIYRALRVINPSPYLFYLDYDDLRLIGSSPEVMVKKIDNTVMVKPIAGTRPRGATPAEDCENEQDLLRDKKELAEHLMLVDLGRNDVGRVASPGSVRVENFMNVERYSHVMHIVSTVKGTIDPNLSLRELVRATFPAGTVSGAPKVRAMEIISELEPHQRCVYAGLIGYYSFSGNFDSCIAIRTLVQKDDQLYLQVGAGIVADSDPEREYEETINKAKALVRAIEMTRGGLQ